MIDSIVLHCDRVVTLYTIIFATQYTITTFNCFNVCRCGPILFPERLLSLSCASVAVSGENETIQYGGSTDVQDLNRENTGLHLRHCHMDIANEGKTSPYWSSSRVTARQNKTGSHLRPTPVATVHTQGHTAQRFGAKFAVTGLRDTGKPSYAQSRAGPFIARLLCYRENVWVPHVARRRFCWGKYGQRTLTTSADVPALSLTNNINVCQNLSGRKETIPLLT